MGEEIESLKEKIKEVEKEKEEEVRRSDGWSEAMTAYLGLS